MTIVVDNKTVLFAIWAVFLLGSSFIGTFGTRLMPTKKETRLPYIRSYVAKYFLRESGYYETDLPTNSKFAIYTPNTFFSCIYIAITTTMFGKAFADRYFRAIYAAIRGLYLGKNDAASHGWAVVAVAIVIVATVMLMVGLMWLGTWSTTLTIQERCKENGFVVKAYSRRGVVSVFHFVASSIVRGVDKMQVKLRHSMRVRTEKR